MITNCALLIFLLLLAAAVTFLRSVGTAFALVYLPALILLHPIRAVQIPCIPDLSASTAVIYGIIGGFLLKAGGGEALRLRLHLVDWTVLLLAAAATVSAATQVGWYTAVNEGGHQAFTWVAPYVLARLAFQTPAVRQQAFWSVAICTVVLGLFALIEMRLWPQTYVHTLGLLFDAGQSEPTLAYRRFGLFRTRLSLGHPIYVGDAALVLMGMLAVLARTSGLRLRHPMALAGLGAALLMLLSSISFGPYLALMVAAPAFALIYWVRPVRWLLAPGVLMASVLGAGSAWSLLSIDTRDRLERGDLGNSFETRALIIQNSLRLVPDAGLLGFGQHQVPAELNLESVDNAYLVFILVWGWLYLALWMLMLIAMACHLSRTLCRATDSSQAFPPAVSAAVMFGMIAALFVVWADRSFTVPWIVLAGGSVTLGDILLGTRALPIAPQGLLQRPRPVPVAPTPALLTFDQLNGSLPREARSPGGI